MRFKKHYNISMFIDCNHNLIAAWRTLDEVLPYKQYKGGARDKDKPVYQDPKDSSSNPVLLLEFDILNEHGFGLKRGFYEIATDEDYSTLMFVESGKIKAKIPVIAQEVINEYGNDFEWKDDKENKTVTGASKSLGNDIGVYSKTIYKKTYTDKELKKRREKYKKGMDPTLYFHSKTYLEYDRELDVYKVIWEKYNTRLIGVIKL